MGILLVVVVVDLPPTGEPHLQAGGGGHQVAGGMKWSC